MRKILDIGALSVHGCVCDPFQVGATAAIRGNPHPIILGEKGIIRAHCILSLRNEPRLRIAIHRLLRPANRTSRTVRKLKGGSATGGKDTRGNGRVLLMMIHSFFLLWLLLVKQPCCCY